MATTLDTILIIAMLSFLPVALLRIVLLCRTYLLTGTFGNMDNGMFFGLILYLQSDDEDKTSLKDVVKYFFTGVHPLPMLMDGCTYTVSVMIISAIINVSVDFPYVPLIFIAFGLFILLLRIMRKRIAQKQKFIGNLKGDQL